MPYELLNPSGCPVPCPPLAGLKADGIAAVDGADAIKTPGTKSAGHVR